MDPVGELSPFEETVDARAVLPQRRDTKPEPAMEEYGFVRQETEESSQFPRKLTEESRQIHVDRSEGASKFSIQSKISSSKLRTLRARSGIHSFGGGGLLFEGRSFLEGACGN